MAIARERKLLQQAVGLLALVPISAGLFGVMFGPEGLLGDRVSVSADSHFRYLSGLLFAIGLAFASCIPGIERKTARFRLLALLVFIGGLGRLFSFASIGLPGSGHVFGLVMELVTVPLLVLWQARVAAAGGDPAGSAA